MKAKLTPDRRKHGCDSCHKNVPTEMFLGYRGNVLWICGSCYTIMTNNLEKKHKQDIWTYKNHEGT